MPTLKQNFRDPKGNTSPNVEMDFMKNIFSILLAYSSLFALSLIDNGRAPAYPQILEFFKITTAEGSLLFTIAAMASLVVNLSARKWLPSLGVIKATLLAMVFLSLGSYLIGHAGTVNYFNLGIAGSFILGTGLSITTITMNILVAQGSDPYKRQKIFSGLHAIYGIGSFLVPFLYNRLIDLHVNWMVFFKILAITPMAVLITALLFLKGKGKNITLDDSMESFSYPVNWRKRILFGLIFGFYVGAEITLSSRLSLYLQNVEGMSLVQANHYLSYFFIGILSGRLFFTFFSLPFSNITLMKGSLVIGLILFFVGFFIDPLALPLCGLAFSGFFPIALDWLSHVFPQSKEVMVTSIMTCIGILLTGMHGLFGTIGNLLGLQYAILMIPLCLIGSLLLLILIKNPKNESIHFKL